MSKKLLYYCSFVPVRMLRRAGFEMVNIQESYRIGRKGSEKLPGSPCGFVQSCLNLSYEEYEGMIFTDCCDSSRRLFDYIQFHYPDMFLHNMEIPRQRGGSIGRESLFVSLERHFGIPIDREPVESEKKSHGPETPEIVFIASCLNSDYWNSVEDIFKNYTCTPLTCLNEKRGDVPSVRDVLSCPRMLDFYISSENRLRHAEGVVFISSRNCDALLFSWNGIEQICREKRIKILMVEDEYGKKISSSSRIRYEAFLEQLEMGRR